MSVMCDKVINLAQRQIGTKESPVGSNRTKYGVYFDTPKSKGGPYPWFNGKKNGVPWCSLWICWLFCQNEILGYEKARTFLGCPKPADNCAAGVPYLWEYLKALGWQVDKKAGQMGDIIFFGSLSHVGIIEKVDANNYYTIEGNKDNQVKRCTYSRGNSYIYGIMRPEYESMDPKPEPEPTPEPTPEPVVTVLDDYQVVNIKTFLAIRSTPEAREDDKNKVGELYNGAVVTVFETKNGWAKIGGEAWVSLKYLKKV